MMLFGAQLDRIRDRCRLAVKRDERAWPSLVWAAATWEMQDGHIELMRMTATASTKPSITFTTGTSRLLMCAHRRWYSTGRMAIPNDIKITRESLAFWLVGTMAGKISRATSIHIVTPFMQHETAEWIARDIENVGGWKCEVKGRGMVMETAAVTAWLDRILPRKVWDAHA